jgi:Tfp pilus assembly protein PilO
MAIKLTKQQQQMIALGVLMLGGFGYSYVAFFWLPISAKIKEANEKIAEVEKKIEKAQQQAGRLARLQQELVTLNQQAEDAEKRLPKQKDVPDILLNIGNLAEKAQVDLVSFAPGPASGKSPHFSELNYPMSIKGSFHNIGKFFALVSLEDRIYNLQNVVYGAPDGGGSMTVSFTLVSYQYKGG